MPPPIRSAILAVLAVAALSCADGPAGAAERKKGGGESFLQLPSLNAGILRRSGRHGVLSVEVGLDVPDAGLRARAEKSMPRLRDAYDRFLTLYAGAIPPGGAPDPEAVGARLQQATDQVLGRPGARVLLGTLLVN